MTKKEWLFLSVSLIFGVSGGQLLIETYFNHKSLNHNSWKGPVIEASIVVVIILLFAVVRKFDSKDTRSDYLSDHDEFDKGNQDWGDGVILKKAEPPRFLYSNPEDIRTSYDDEDDEGMIQIITDTGHGGHEYQAFVTDLNLIAQINEAENKRTKDPDESIKPKTVTFE